MQTAKTTETRSPKYTHKQGKVGEQKQILEFTKMQFPSEYNILMYQHWLPLKRHAKKQEVWACENVHMKQY